MTFLVDQKQMAFMKRKHSKDFDNTIIKKIRSDKENCYFDDDDAIYEDYITLDDQYFNEIGSCLVTILFDNSDEIYDGFRLVNQRKYGKDSNKFDDEIVALFDNS